MQVHAVQTQNANVITIRHHVCARQVLMQILLQIKDVFACQQSVPIRKSVPKDMCALGENVIYVVNKQAPALLGKDVFTMFVQKCVTPTIIVYLVKYVAMEVFVFPVAPLMLIALTRKFAYKRNVNVAKDIAELLIIVRILMNVVSNYATLLQFARIFQEHINVLALLIPSETHTVTRVVKHQKPAISMRIVLKTCCVLKKNVSIHVTLKNVATMHCVKLIIVKPNAIVRQATSVVQKKNQLDASVLNASMMTNVRQIRNVKQKRTNVPILAILFHVAKDHVKYLIMRQSVHVLMDTF